MKNNKDILANTFEPNGFSIQRALGLADDHTLIADPAYKRILFAMKEAQVEAIKELMMRENLWLMGTDDRSKSIYTAINNAMSQLIKEIES